MPSGLSALGGMKTAYTPEFTFVKGEYKFGSELVSYFSVTMDVNEAVKSLTLPRDVVLDPLAPIKMKELFQRELDENHGAEIVEYLKQPKQPRFFNALTAVVLPIDPDGGRRLAHSYESLQDRPPFPQDQEFDAIDVGPVRIRALKTNARVGAISWDSRLSRAVVVDGQHRLWAMKSLLADTSFPFRQDLAETTIPVLVIVLHKDAGFSSDLAEDQSVIGVCRSIFIDLNKHAMKVSNARTILLDDRDLGAVAMRNLMSDAVGGTYAPVDERVASTKQLPLALIDWSSEDARFDAGPYITTTLTLYDLCQMALSYTAPSPTNYSAQRDYIAALTARLGLESNPPFADGVLKREIDRAEEKGLPFALGHYALTVAADGFRETWGPYIVRPLTELRPYRDLVKHYEETGLLSGTHEQWLGLDQAGRNAYVEEVGVDPGDLAYDIYTTVKPLYRLAYQVVFQKAFIQCLVEMERYSSVLSEYWGGTPDDGSNFISTWVTEFNSRVANSLNDNEAWSGAGIGPTGTISWTQASQRAIASFLAYALIAPLNDWSVMDDEAATEAAEEWLESAWSHTGSGRPANSIEGVYKLGAPWKRSATSHVKALFKAREEERTPDEADVLHFAASRLLRVARQL